MLLGIFVGVGVGVVYVCLVWSGIHGGIHKIEVYILYLYVDYYRTAFRKIKLVQVASYGTSIAICSKYGKLMNSYSEE